MQGCHGASTHSPPIDPLRCASTTSGAAGGLGSGIEAPPPSDSPSDYAAVVPTDISPASGAQTVDNKTYPADGVNLAPLWSWRLAESNSESLTSISGPPTGTFAVHNRHRQLR